MTSTWDDDVRSSTDESFVLGRFLDSYRDAVVRKTDGLDRDGASRSFVDSATTVLGIVKHLADVERWWFDAVFSGGDPAFHSSQDDQDADWRIEAGDTVEGIVDDYRRACAASRRLIAGHALDETAARSGFDHVTLRWIVVHMIEETARHAGHADILRELTDGAVG